MDFEWVRELNEGVKKIFSDMAGAGLPEPEYVETPNTVRLILRNNIDVRQNKTSNDAKNEAINDALNEAINNILNGIINESEQQIIGILKTNPTISQARISNVTGFSRSKVQRILKKLVADNVVCREGARKNGFWRVSGK